MLGNWVKGMSILEDSIACLWGAPNCLRIWMRDLFKKKKKIQSSTL